MSSMTDFAKEIQNRRELQALQADAREAIAKEREARQGLLQKLAAYDQARREAAFIAHPAS